MLIAASAASAGYAGCGAAAAAASTKVPPALRIPAGQVLVLAARGVGVQIYECTASAEDPQHFSWALLGPEAILRSKSGEILGRHYAGPTWEANDGSKVTGEVVAKADAPDATAIPWLMLRAKSMSGTGIFGAILSIQRLRTAGGKAPATDCGASQSGERSRVRYSADYRFYAARP